MRGLLAVLVAVVAVTVSGCGFSGLYDTPLPGGADLGPQPYRVSAYFNDTLDLVPQSGVRVNDIAVGRVDAIELAPDGLSAEVSLLVNGSVRLPANAIARLRQSSALGEKFVELAAPTGSTPQGRLSDGAVIAIERTNRNTEIEEVLGALSLVLNGGGIGQIEDISRELNTALHGRTADIKAFIGNMKTFVGSFANNRDEITRAIDATDKFAATLAGRKDKIAGLIEDLEPGMKVLAEQRGKLVAMLKALDSLSHIAADTVVRTKDDLIADLRSLAPVLENIARSGSDLPRSMEMLLTFPFPDEALKAVKGDYLNLFLDIDTDTAAATNGGGR